MKTDWGHYYLNRPSSLSHLYPDCFGAIERLEQDRETRIARWVSRILTAIIAVSATMALLHFLERLQ